MTRVVFGKAASALAIALLAVGASAAGEPSRERLERDLLHFASPAMAGRGTGTEGARMAAAYAAEHFAASGLAPAGAVGADGKASFLQPFSFTAGIEVVGKSDLGLATPATMLSPALGEGFNPLGFSQSGALERAPVAFCGYGITSAEHGYDDYAEIDPKGKVVLVFDGAPEPPADSEKAAAAQPLRRYASIRYKAMNARERGALAVIVIARPRSDGSDQELVRVEGRSFGGDAGIFALDLRRSLAERFVGLAQGGLEYEATDPTPLATLQAAIDGDLRPRSTDLAIANVTIRVELRKDRRECANVLARVTGTDPKLRDEVVVIGAHYDHLGDGGQGGSLSGTKGIHHGADDNASGSAAVLELARHFAANPPRRSVVLALWSGEELGLLGSNHFVKSPTFPLAQVAAYLNLDMVGRLRDGKLTVSGTGTALEWAALVDEPAAKLGLKLGRDADGFGPSDYSSFYGAEVPVLGFFTGVHSDYHTPADTADKIEWDGLVRVTALTAAIARAVADADARPTYQRTKGDPHDRAMTVRGPSVYLGTVPDYADDEAPGVRLAGVREGSPAARAGLKAGDRVVRFGGQEVRDVQDYTFALFSKSPGDKVEIIVRRGGELVELTATMGKKGDAPASPDPHGAPAPHGDPHHAPADPHHHRDPHHAPADPHHHPDPHHAPADPHHHPGRAHPPMPKAPSGAPAEPTPRRASF